MRSSSARRPTGSPQRRLRVRRHRAAAGQGPGRAAAGVPPARPARAHGACGARRTASACTVATPSSPRSPAALAPRPGAGPARSSRTPAPARAGCCRRPAPGRPGAWYEGGCAPNERTAPTGPGPTRSRRSPTARSTTACGSCSAATSTTTSSSCRRPCAATSSRATSPRSCATAAPCVVVLEDLHWADQPSLDLLDDVLFEVGDADVLRPRDLPGEGARRRRADRARARSARPRRGRPRWSRDLLGGDPPDDLVDEVVRRSGGNPLYVGELAFALRDRGLVSLVDGDVLVTAAAGLAQALDLVPDSVEGLIGARIDALPAAQERALTIAAALGSPVDERLVVEVAAELAEPTAEVPAALAGLREARMIAGRRLRPRAGDEHGVLRGPRGPAAGGSTWRPPQSASRCVADDELPGFLARHLYLAGAGARALAALENAAEDALTRGAHDEALLHLYRDLELRRSADVEPERRAVAPRVGWSPPASCWSCSAGTTRPSRTSARRSRSGPARSPTAGWSGRCGGSGRYDDVVADRRRSDVQTRPSTSRCGSGSAGRRRRRWPRWVGSTPPSPPSCPASTPRPRLART